MSQSRSGSYSFSRQRSYCGYEGSAVKYSQGQTNRISYNSIYNIGIKNNLKQ